MALGNGSWHFLTRQIFDTEDIKQDKIALLDIEDALFIFGFEIIRSTHFFVC